MSDLNVGDVVEVLDGSYSVRVDQWYCSGDNKDYIGISNSKFEVVLTQDLHKHETRTGYNIHDIYIKNLDNNRVYLHSSCMVKKINKTKTLILEVTDTQAYKIMEMLK